MEAREEAREIDWRLLVGDEWAEWYAMTPAERLEASSKLWQTYLQLGGSLDPEPDSQSPFFDPAEWRAGALDGRPGLRVVRRGGV
jgi:hypothetical protein